MNVMIRSKNIELTPALKEQTEKKLSKLGKYFGPGLQPQVALSVEKDRHIVEITLSLNGILIRGEETSDDMYASLDRAVEKIERQIRKYKTRINRRQRRDGSLRPSQPLINEEAFADAGAGAGVEPEEEFRVVRSKRFSLKPMSVEEAILQMNLLGHDFFVFINAETEETSVVYRRHHGDYGLIESDR